MIEIPRYLELALEADDRDRLERLIAEGDESDFDLLQLLVEREDTPPNYRRKAMYALGRWPDRKETAASTIAAAMPKLTELERITAVDALGRIGTDAALNAVMGYAADDDADVRRQVVKALDRIGTAPAVEALDRMAAEDNVDYVRSLAQEKAEAVRRRKGDP